LRFPLDISPPESVCPRELYTLVKCDQCRLLAILEGGKLWKNSKSRQKTEFKWADFAYMHISWFQLAHINLNFLLYKINANLGSLLGWILTSVRTIEKIVLNGDWFGTKIKIHDFCIFKVPFFSYLILKDHKSHEWLNMILLRRCCQITFKQTKVEKKSLNLV
jgi:hypothetical protein